MPDATSSSAARLRGSLSAIVQSFGVKDSFVLAIAMTFAGSLDYMVHILVGRWLRPLEYGIFVAVTALVQLLIFFSTTIRSVIGFYAAELRTRPNAFGDVAALTRQSWQWAWRWGIAGTVLSLICSPLLAHQFRLPNSAPIWAASLMVLMLFLRQVTHGILQGIQAFAALAVVLVLQALLRLILAMTFVWIGTRAVGAVAAQSISCALTVAAAVWWLRPYFRGGSSNVSHTINVAYPLQTLLGLTAFGVLTNIDALFVKHYFTPLTAGEYGPVTSLAKISLFLPWALGFIMLPKVKQHQAAGQDTRPILVLALATALAPGLLLTVFYSLFPGAIVSTIFGSAYANPGHLLALVNLAATLYAGVYIWLNYALALNRPAFVYASIAVVACQVFSMAMVGRHNLIYMALAMISGAVFGHLAGFVTTWSCSPVPCAQPVELAAS